MENAWSQLWRVHGAIYSIILRAGIQDAKHTHKNLCIPQYSWDHATCWRWIKVWSRQRLCLLDFMAVALSLCVTIGHPQHEEILAVSFSWAAWGLGHFLLTRSVPLPLSTCSASRVQVKCLVEILSLVCAFFLTFLRTVIQGIVVWLLE